MDNISSNPGSDTSNNTASTREKPLLAPQLSTVREEKLTAVALEKGTDTHHNADSSSICDDLSTSTDAHSDDTSSPSQHSADTSGEDAEAIIPAQRETSQLCCLRGIVGTALLLATFMVSVVIYYTTRRSELEQFELQFGDHSDNILEAFQQNILDGIAAMDNLAIAVLSFTAAVANNTTTSSASWPQVVIPEFAVRATSTRYLVASASVISFAPLVTRGNRQEWEAFALQSQEWVQEGLDYDAALQEKLPWNSEDAPRSQFLQDQTAEASSTTTVDFSQGIASRIYRQEQDGSGVEEDEDAPGPFFPVWQHSPVTPALVNYNLLSHAVFGPELQISLQSKQVVVGQVAPSANNNNRSQTSFGAVDGDILHLPSDPLSNIYFPLVNKNDEVVGILLETFHWESYLYAGVLPASANGIHCVLVNHCGQSFTFQVQPQGIYYVGEGDLHDTAFDYLEHSIELDKAQQQHTLLLFSGVEYNPDYCPYSLHVYPTKDSQKEYFTSRPIIYTALVVLTFLFTTFVFVTYDRLVERRQAVVMKTAVESHAIVSSLFPKTVRDRLFGINTDGDSGGGGEPDLSSVNQQKKDTGSAGLGTKAQLKSFMNTGSMVGQNSKPIADLVGHLSNPNTHNLLDVFVIPQYSHFYFFSLFFSFHPQFPHTTVLFADIAGFTAWSSMREPAQVFTLLETIYGKNRSKKSSRNVGSPSYTTNYLICVRIQ
jgi:hypothetical protein